MEEGTRFEIWPELREVVRTPRQPQLNDWRVLYEYIYIYIYICICICFLKEHIYIYIYIYIYVALIPSFPAKNEQKTLPVLSAPFFRKVCIRSANVWKSLIV